MTSADWFAWVASMVFAVAVGIALGHWIHTRGRETVAEVEAVDPHNLYERPVEPR